MYCVTVFATRRASPTCFVHAEIWTYQQKAELDLWESFDVEAQQ